MQSSSCFPWRRSRVWSTEGKGTCGAFSTHKLSTIVARKSCLLRHVSVFSLYSSYAFIRARSTKLKNNFFQYRLDDHSAATWYTFVSLMSTPPMYLLYAAIQWGLVFILPAAVLYCFMPAGSPVLSMRTGFVCDFFSRNATASRVPWRKNCASPTFSFLGSSGKPLELPLTVPVNIVVFPSSFFARVGFV